jgi:hypothetical protein
MIIRPELQALRVDDSPQRHAQAALRQAYENWRTAGPGRQAEAEVRLFSSGAVLEDLPLLSALFAPEDESAAQFIGDLLAQLMVRLRAEPLSQMPLRFSSDETLSSLLIARHGTATLMLQAIDGAGLARKPAPVSAIFPPTETFERVMAGSADAIQVRTLTQRPDSADLACEPVAMRPGLIQRRFGPNEAQLLHRVPTQLVTLKLQRRTAAAEVTRQYRLNDGALVHQAAGSPRDSRLELSAALLGRMGRKDAAPLLAAMAEEHGSAALRWQALRECLGLDSAAGFVVLCRLSQNAADPLAAHAGALRAQLLETYPQLAGACPCPA